MSPIVSIPIKPLSRRRLDELVGPERAGQLDATAAASRELLAGRRLVNVSSTAKGGGVAELLQTLLAYTRGVGIDSHWLVLDAEPEFFTITKRLHNHLYGGAGDGGPLGDVEHARYETTSERNALELLATLRDGDLVLLHDPQTAGLAPLLDRAGVIRVWRCHVGRDEPNEHSELAWSFLRPYLDAIDAYVFTRPQFAPPWVPPTRLHVIPPSIDPFSTKNMDLDPTLAREILGHVGLLGDGGHACQTTFVRPDGTPGRVDRRADILQAGPPPSPDVPLVVQVSRWDAMKDMAGVMEAFARYVDGATDAHLELVGPAVHGVADDPEAAAVLDDCVERWRTLPHAIRTRIHLACVPMHDPDETAVIVNALQRHATVVTQKSLAEGFGLTVTEAMWKHKPVVASRVGGIADQIEDGEDGLLVDDPHDLQAFGSSVQRVLADPALAGRLGDAAHLSVFEEYLGDRHLERFARLFADLLDPAPQPPSSSSTASPGSRMSSGP